MRVFCVNETKVLSRIKAFCDIATWMQYTYSYDLWLSNEIHHDPAFVFQLPSQFSQERLNHLFDKNCTAKLNYVHIDPKFAQISHCYNCLSIFLLSVLNHH